MIKLMLLPYICYNMTIVPKINLVSVNPCFVYISYKNSDDLCQFPSSHYIPSFRLSYVVGIVGVFEVAQNLGIMYGSRSSRLRPL